MARKSKPESTSQIIPFPAQKSPVSYWGRPESERREFMFQAALKELRKQRVKERFLMEGNLRGFRSHEPHGRPANGNAAVREIKS